jgi:hypothetical protein
VKIRRLTLPSSLQTEYRICVGRTEWYLRCEFNLPKHDGLSIHRFCPGVYRFDFYDIRTDAFAYIYIIGPLRVLIKPRGWS